MNIAFNLKKLFVVSSFLALAAAFATPVSATELDKRSPERSPPGTVQVQISIPPPTRILLEQDVQELIYTELVNTFKEKGYQGPIEEVKLYEDPSPGCSLLKIDVTELRRDPIGNIVCSFNASLQTGNTSKNLGTFRGTALPGIRTPGVGGSRDSVETASASALTQLYSALAKTELIPGLREKKS